MASWKEAEIGVLGPSSSLRFSAEAAAEAAAAAIKLWPEEACLNPGAK